MEKNLDVYVRVGITEHPATIDSMVRLTEELVDTNSVRIKWSNNKQRSVVDLSTVKPMHSSHREMQKKEKKEKTSQCRKDHPWYKKYPNDHPWASPRFILSQEIAGWTILPLMSLHQLQLQLFKTEDCKIG